ncbi:MAG: nicotinic acid mononucleotide adenylyltransferase [Candidatus Omnitrophica bacterium CG_4_9_14_0_2_um_filter_42_8]|nr:MAG: nicotinic acid mononucleotide adenylyltransferase [Candidatus Omnitrophica bacterium CG22_combo_CG10-13_8_21_14_all_43_16]PJC47247.1 MAG: nicotinic acid mononucleotide adenylyltransferase [Candidatus Omnitrophica bacterium CG_4_9_14_0_2_um_filter_42_8]
MRIGILGGTFDPVHNGHMHLAEKISKKLSLDKLIFIPVYIPPHKKGAKVTQARHRYNMLKLAVSGSKIFKLSDMEIKRKGRSYSIETLRRLKRKYGANAELFFITGSDSLGELDKWKNLEEILKLCKFVVVERPGFETGNPPENIIYLKVSAKDISATQIRSLIKTGRHLSGILPGMVERYIYRNKLYV